MTFIYERPADPGQGLRLHLNENTAGCSPAVLAALRRLTAEDLATYPDYGSVTAACARHFGVGVEELVLTNGLDEGILAASVAWLCGDRAGRDALVIEPAFDMYAACTEAAGGRVRPIAPRADFSFPLRETLAAITASTRLVFLTNPNNPTGRPIDRQAILDILAAVPADALVFLDEAYVEFGGESFLTEVRQYRQAVVGRTFAKAYGLAGIRAGAVLGRADTLARLRPVVPPYSLNRVAATALEAALDDRAFVARYLEEVAASKRELYAALDRLGLAYWPSAANFVLVRAGGRAAELVAGLARRGIFVRDRSGQPGCDGCVRITTGVLAHTRACITALEAVLCDVPS